MTEYGRGEHVPPRLRRLIEFAYVLIMIDIRYAHGRHYGLSRSPVENRAKHEPQVCRIVLKVSAAGGLSVKNKKRRKE